MDIQNEIVNQGSKNETSLTQRQLLYKNKWSTHYQIILKKITDEDLEAIAPHVDLAGEFMYCDTGAKECFSDRLEREWKEIEAEMNTYNKARACSLSISSVVLSIQTVNQARILVKADKDKKLQIYWWTDCIRDLLAEAVIARDIDILDKMFRYEKFSYRLPKNYTGGEWFRLSVANQLMDFYLRQKSDADESWKCKFADHCKFLYDFLPGENNKFIFKFDLYMATYLSRNADCMAICENLFAGSEVCGPEDFKPDALDSASNCAMGNHLVALLTKENSEDTDRTSVIAKIISDDNFGKWPSNDGARWMCRTPMYKFLALYDPIKNERYFSKHDGHLLVKKIYESFPDDNPRSKQLKLMLKFDYYTAFALQFCPNIGTWGFDESLIEKCGTIF